MPLECLRNSSVSVFLFVKQVELVWALSQTDTVQIPPLPHSNS